jgi:hypothetical protein
MIVGQGIAQDQLGLSHTAGASNEDIGGLEISVWASAGIFELNQALSDRFDNGMEALGANPKASINELLERTVIPVGDVERPLRGQTVLVNRRPMLSTTGGNFLLDSGAVKKHSDFSFRLFSFLQQSRRLVELNGEGLFVTCLVTGTIDSSVACAV